MPRTTKSARPHRPIIIDEVIHGCRVLRADGHDEHGNRMVVTDCGHCPKTGRPRFKDLCAGRAKSCGCRSIATWREIASDYLRSMDLEEVDNIFSAGVLGRMNDWQIAAKYEISHDIAVYIRRSGWERLKALGSAFKREVIEFARFGSGEGYKGLSPAEVLVVCKLDIQAQAALAAVAARPANIPDITEPVATPIPAQVTQILTAQTEWGAWSEVERETALELANATYSESIKVNDACKEIDWKAYEKLGLEADLPFIAESFAPLSRSMCKKLRPFTSLMKLLHTDTHGSLFGGNTQLARENIDDSEAHNAAQFKFFKNLRAADEAAGITRKRSSGSKWPKAAWDCSFDFNGVGEKARTLNTMSRERVDFQEADAA